MRYKSLIFLVLIFVSVSFMPFTNPFSENDIQRIKNYSQLQIPSALASSEYENKTVHDGNIIVEGNEVFLIKDCEYTQTGNITIRDNAKLIIQNAVLHWNLSEPFSSKRSRISLLNSSEFIATNSEIDCWHYSFSIYIRNDAKVVFENVSSASAVLSCLENSTLNIYGSTVSQIQSYYGYFNTDIHIVNSEVRGHILSYGALHVEDTIASGRIDFMENAHGQIINSVTSYKITISGSSNVQIMNTTGALFISGSSNVQIMNTTGALFISETCNVLIVNSTEKISISSLDGVLQVINSTIIDLSMESSDCILIFEDTTFGLEDPNYYAPPHSFYIYFSNNRDIPYFYGNLSFTEYVALGGMLDDYFVEGWWDSILVRNFNVLCQQQNGKPVTDIQLHLFDDNGTLVWNGTTDHYGVVNFNLTYMDYNYTTSNVLKVSNNEGEYVAETYVTFLSETPLILQLGDITLPIFSITSPEIESEMKLTDLMITWYSSDASGIDHYEVKLDEGSWIDLGIDVSYSFFGVMDGTHTVFVKAVDTAGNSKVEQVTFTVDTSLFGGPGWTDDVAVIGGLSIIAIVGLILIYRRKKSRTIEENL